MHIVRFLTPALAGATALACALPALAQPAGDTVDWNGVYAGLNAGWNDAATQAGSGLATTHTTSTAVPTDTFPTRQMDYSSSSWAVGGQIGANKQIGHYVFGVEGDFDGVGGRSGQLSSYDLTRPPTAGGTVGIDRVTRPDWTSTIRARAGYAVGPVLFYGTGGLALAQANQAAYYSYSGPTTGGTPGPYSNAAVHNEFMAGWTAGGGVEWALTHQISVGAEYRHSDYGHQPNFVGNGVPGATSENNTLGYSDDQVLAKVNYKFGAGIF